MRGIYFDPTTRLQYLFIAVCLFVNTFFIWPLTGMQIPVFFAGFFVPLLLTAAYRHWKYFVQRTRQSRSDKK